MRRVLAAVTAAAVLTVAGCGLDSSPADDPDGVAVDVDTPKLREMKAEAGIEDCAPGPGDGKLPALTLACLGGGPAVALDDLRGPLLINIWASNCGPCRDEMPLLQQFHEHYGDRFGVLGVDIETTPDRAISFAGLVDATYPQVADPGGFIWEEAALGLKPGLPQTLLVGADGSLLAKRAGEFTSIEELSAFAEDAL